MIILQNLKMRFGAKILFDNVNLQFQSGQRYGLVGANGSGKTTLFKIVLNEVSAEAGDCMIPKDVRLGALLQNQHLYDQETLLNTVLRGRPALWAALQKQQQLQTSQDGFAIAACEENIEKEGGYSAPSQAAKILEGLGIPLEKHQASMSMLSGGYKLRVLLAQLLFSEPEVLLLDEPTNHLDVPSINWLITYLNASKATLLLISHDRHFLNQTCTSIADIDYGTIKLYSGSYEHFLRQKEAEREQKELQYEGQEKKKEHLEKFVDRFRAKASKARQAQSKLKMIEKMEKTMEEQMLLPSSRVSPHFAFSISRLAAAIPLKVQGVCKSFSGRCILHNIAFEIHRGEKVALIGPNGVGKSTLLKIIISELSADTGSYEWSANSHIAYYPQNPKELASYQGSLLEWLNIHVTEATQEQQRASLGRMFFSKDEVTKLVDQLSGGELARLFFAKIMLQKHNILILDEPTNHLDIEAIEALIEALKNYEGTLLFVSHNQYFISQLAERVIELKGEGLAVSDKSVSSKATTQSYEMQKKQRNQKRALQQQISKIEKEIQQLEEVLKKIENTLLTPEFYVTVPLEEQKSVQEEKQRLEKSHSQLLQQWEEKSLELETSS